LPNGLFWIVKIPDNEVDRAVQITDLGSRELKRLLGVSGK